MPIKEIHEKPITVIQVNTIIDMVHVVVIIIITNLKKSGFDRILIQEPEILLQC